ncbi:glycoside hydrolase family 3 C-terminal domain-containing protein [Butyrivibrio sp. JL13D10]|uniref:glycoside hydrolase family 3 protein n=1 Tax=Butyrivibrio sp. JL13D10 TaxID=3236815 RepID=UPI0038B4E3CB
MKKWTRAKFQPNLPLYKDKRVTASDAHISLSKEAAREGMVLLKNDNDALPVGKGKRLALFGKGTFDYVKGGGGSGDVYTVYTHDIYDGFKSLGVSLYEPVCDFYRNDIRAKYANGDAPGMTIEPEIDAELIRAARSFTDTAVISISRFSGEGWDRSDVEYEAEYNPWGNEVSMPKKAGKIFPKGDFYLTDNEEKLIDEVSKTFEKTIVVLNVGGVVDTKWIKNNSNINAALLAWQGGMEGGTAAAEIIMGVVNPSGKLPDTFAMDVTDYPSTEGFHESPDYVNYTEDIYVGYRYFETLKDAAEKVVYPFGYGLSYTDFDTELLSASESGDGFKFKVKVTNIGKREGREVIALYLSAPQGKLGKAARSLVSFEKTRLLKAGEAQVISLYVSRYQLASYDDLGKIEKSAYVLEKGDYRFYLGANVRDAILTDYVYTVGEDAVYKRLSEQLSPVSLPKRLLADGSYEELPTGTARDINDCIFEKMVPGSEEAIVPESKARGRYLLMKPYEEGKKPLIDVFEGKITLDEFLEQLTDDDLIDLLGGQSNTGVANTWGVGNKPEYGIPNVMTSDGPAGIRISEECEVPTTAWPCSTLLASTWNREIIYAVGVAGGEELKENNMHIWLTPAVNIHRNPMCGRNFEYYSEDPYLAGKLGAEMVKGIQSNNVACSVKHFAVNNKETNRKHSDSRLSERALREIYLKVFEIIVKEADPWTIMSSYNAINGYRASECRDLLTNILREEWGFKGMVTSDWWNRAEQYKEILAGNDVKMANGYPERVKKAMEKGALDRDDLKKCAKRVLEMILKLD